MATGIQFQPDVQARYEAWKADPRNMQALIAAAQNAPFIEKLSSPLTAAVRAGILTPQDFQNAVDNNERYSVGADGAVGPHQGIPVAAKLALGGIGLATGGALLSGLGAGGAAGAAGTAGTTAASVAPAVTTGLASKSWLAPLIGGGLQLAGNVAGAKIAANANSDAAKLQADATAKALAAAQEEQQYKRKQFADYQARLQPYQATGQQAYTRLSDILAQSGIPNVRN